MYRIQIYRDTEYRDRGIQNTDIQGHRIKICWDTGKQEYRYTGIQGYRDTGIEGMRDTEFIYIGKEG